MDGTLTTRYITVDWIAGALGAEIGGVNLAGAIDDAVPAGTRVMHRVTIRGDRPF